MVVWMGHGEHSTGLRTGQPHCPCHARVLKSFAVWTFDLAQATQATLRPHSLPAYSIGDVSRSRRSWPVGPSVAIQSPYKRLDFESARRAQDYTGGVIHDTLGRRISPSLFRAR